MFQYRLELHDTATTHLPGETVNFKPHELSVEQEQRKLFVFLCFSTPFMALTKDGMAVGKAGDCMVVSPSFQELHGPTPKMTEGFVNDWLHVIVHDASIFENKIPLPLNTLIETGNPAFFKPYLEEIDSILLKGNAFQEAMISNVIEALVLKLAEKSLRAEQARSESQWDHKLVGIRQQMNCRIMEDWTVNQLARETGLSVSRFSVLYRQRFGTSPMDDLIQMRLTNAKKMLLSTNLTLHEISTQCGFQSESYFCRLFKSRFGLTPSEYKSR